MITSVLNQHHGWVIQIKRGGSWLTLGKYTWFNGRYEPSPEHMDGYVTAVFKTRRQARAAQKIFGNRRFAEPTRIRKVIVTIEAQ